MTKRDPNDAQTDGLTLGSKANTYDYFAATGKRAKNILSTHPPKPGERILDVGCGTGTLAIALKGAVGAEGYVAGIDAAAKMVGVAKAKAEKIGADVDLRVSAIEKLPFEDNYFDKAYATLMTHHLPMKVKEAGFREVLRVLKPGGSFLVYDFGRPENFLIRALFHPLWVAEKYFLSSLDALEVHIKGKLPETLSLCGFSNVRLAKKTLGIMEYIVAEKSQ